MISDCSLSDLSNSPTSAVGSARAHFGKGEKRYMCDSLDLHEKATRAQRRYATSES